MIWSGCSMLFEDQWVETMHSATSSSLSPIFIHLSMPSRSWKTDSNVSRTSLSGSPSRQPNALFSSSNMHIRDLRVGFEIVGAIVLVYSVFGTHSQDKGQAIFRVLPNLVDPHGSTGKPPGEPERFVIVRSVRLRPNFPACDPTWCDHPLVSE